mmetsp:Transcript_11196/g.22031  ORF Transcript_11196/g.22031 Transcript_11196/m.22031 type:complete len:146 (+) Transcript_11196:431-868(+)|eukprot:CAMPEP_0204918158 /NCGR_PEP_ID=MMETSP1397-20131031/15935_1 /ASSEMBLY_ACC=CAM_ASM_000891 /TAXON_ID=49980 /ORGANISM="Climacostomum Climacostomum virens, Strain Stock W-24" /LENGTH=145 /DNA_ID=CAMNT_0052091325 /DNA_START=430 /DNA_END=867 /DNA_ORIENTATION=+
MSEFSLDFNSDCVIAQVCCQDELSDFVMQANDFSAPFFKQLRTARKVMLCILAIAILMIILGIVVEILTQSGIAMLIPIAFLSFFISNCIYVCWLMKAVAKFSKNLAIWIKGSRGHLYGKGVKPRPGYNGCFILFEANLGVQVRQ